MTESTRPRFLVIPDVYTDDIKMLLRLSVEQLTALAKTQSTELLKAEDSLKVIASATGISRGDALNVWSAATNIVHQRRREKLSDDMLFSDLLALAPEEATALTPEQKTVLLRDVLSDSDESYRLEKAEYLRNSVVPGLISARSVCELRPLFNREKTAIDAAAVVAVFTLTTHDLDHEDTPLVFQATRSSLGILKRCIEEAEKKLDTIEKSFKIKLF